MKKIASIALSLALMLCVLAGCKSGSNEGLTSAKDYLTNMYQTAGKDEVMSMLMDKDVLSVVTIDGVTYSVEWTVEVTKGDKDAVKIGESYEENHVLIDVPELPQKDILFTATATIKDDKGNTETVSFDYKVAGLVPDEDESESSTIAEEETSSDATESEDEKTNTSSKKDENTNTSSKGNTTTNTNTSSKGNTTTNKAPSDPKAIVDAAYALKKDETLDYEATLTGKVISVNEAYDEEYKNITVTIQVEGKEDKPIKCYRMTGTGVDKVKKGDTITVKGTIKNYNNSIQFDANCTMTKRVAGQTSTAVLTDPKDIVAAAFKLAPGEDMGYNVTLEGKVTGVDSAYSADYNNVSVYILVEGKEILCYRMVGNGIDKVDTGDTITVTGKIKNFNGTVEFDQGCTMRNRVAGTGVTIKKLSIVDTPVVGTAYKFGMHQTQMDKVLYAKGDMKGFYMATTENPDAAIDVYLEKATGGYYIYGMVNGAKKYLNIQPSADGQHINAVYADKADMVFKYDSEKKTLITSKTLEKAGKPGEYAFGTYGTHNTIGSSDISYEDNYFCHFYK